MQRDLFLIHQNQPSLPIRREHNRHREEPPPRQMEPMSVAHSKNRHGKHPTSLSPVRRTYQKHRS